MQAQTVPSAAPFSAKRSLEPSPVAPWTSPDCDDGRGLVRRVAEAVIELPFAALFYWVD